MNDRADISDPADALKRLTLRTLWMLYAGFWIAILLYLVVLIALPQIAGGDSAAGFGAGTRPANWEQWQFFLVALGLASVYLSYRLRPFLLDPRAIRRGAANIYELAAQYDSKTESATGGDRLESRQISRAIQDILGRTVGRFVILWILVEVPAIVGVIDRMLSGEIRLFLGMLVLSAIGLVLQRPAADRLGNLLGELPR